jgi:C4-dicarboxylate-binding protein DctP
VNNDWWNGLPEETRGHINAAAAVAQASVRDKMASIEAEAYAAAKENGMTVVELTEDDLAQWKAVSQPVYDAYLTAAGEAGQKVLSAAGN